MIHYHGLPITPATAAVAAIKGGHAFISWAYPDQLGLAMDIAQSFAVDNGAFSAWRNGSTPNWDEYYRWVETIQGHPGFDWAVIPDIINGTEDANDALLNQWPWAQPGRSRGVGVPVWHMHESLDRLIRLAEQWPRVGIGNFFEFGSAGGPRWWNRMAEAMNVVSNDEGHPVCKLHGLRMLNPEVFSRLPLASADSTNIGRNIGIDSKWTGAYQPPSKDVRALVMRECIEAYQSASGWESRTIQKSLVA